MTKWEYYRLHVEWTDNSWVVEYKNELLDHDKKLLDRLLAELGQEGWELVSAVAISETIPFKGGLGSRIGTTSETYIFKRPIEG